MITYWNNLRAILYILNYIKNYIKYNSNYIKNNSNIKNNICILFIYTHTHKTILLKDLNFAGYKSENNFVESK